MERGVITKSNFQNLFRSIAQRRRQGALELGEEEPVRIYFVQGKIVEFERLGQNRVTSTEEWLARSGASFQRGSGSYSELADKVGAEALRRALKHRVLDGLYKLDLKDGLPYTFNVQVVELNPAWSPSLSVGQILLDLVAIDSETDRYNTVFPPGTRVVIARESEENLSEEEGVVFDLIRRGVPFERVEAASLLDHFHFCLALLSLQERGAVASTAAAASPQLPAAEVAERMEQTIDRAFEITKAARPVSPARGRFSSIFRAETIAQGLAFLAVALTLILPFWAWQPLIEAFGGRQ